MDDNCNQKQAAAMFGVDERELRDYVDWSCGVGDMLNKDQKMIFDYAYQWYCDNNADRNFKFYLGESAQYYGHPKRPMEEIWEVNPIAYPSGYLDLRF